MASYRLKPAHPLVSKVDKLFAFLEAEGITISHGYNGLYIVDEESQQRYQIKDVESGIGDGPLTEYPAQFEYKITFDE